VGTLTRVTHDDLRDQAAAYALGALSRDERVAFETHLLECGECDEEARSFTAIATALATSAPPASPDRHLRDRAVDVESRPVPRPAHRAAAYTPWLVAAASIAVAVALGAQLMTQRRSAANSVSAVVVLGAEDLVRVDLAGQPVAPRASARAFWSRTRGLIVTASQLPPLPAGRTYQLWIIVGEKPVGAGFLRPAGDGTVRAVFNPPAPAANVAAFAVTLEPDGGVPAPTGDKYLVGLVN